MVSRALRLFLSAALLGSPAAAGGPASDAPSSRNQADQLEIGLRAVRTAFEKGLPPIAETRPVLQRLSDGADDAGLDPAWAERRREAARKLLGTLDEVVALQAGPAYAPHRAIQGMGPAEQRMIEGLAQTVDRLSDALDIPEAPRRAAIVDLYLRRWQKDRTGLTPAAADAERKFAADSLRRSMRSQETARRKVDARLADGASFRTNAADGGAAVSATPGGRTVAEVIAEARRQKDPSISLRPAAPPPSLADSLRASAERDDEAMRNAGDDGTVWGAIGHGAAYLKKAGAGVAAYFVDGETWERTGSALVGLASHPVDSIAYLPGGVYAGGREMARGVKTDIVNAREEVGNFLEHPSVYRGMAVLGSTSLAVSNAFIVGGGAKSAVRRGAMRDVDAAARDATRVAARGESIGAEAAVRKPVTHPEADRIYGKTAADGDNIPFKIDVLKTIKVEERVTTTAEKQLLHKQTGPTCVFGALCNSFQGVNGAGPKDVLESIRRENPAYMQGAMEASNIDAQAMARIYHDLCGKALVAPVELSTPEDFLAHMRASGHPVTVGVQTGTGKHAIALSEGIVTDDGKVYFKTLDTNISERPGSDVSRHARFGMIEREDLRKILTTKGYSFL